MANKHKDSTYHQQRDLNADVRADEMLELLPEVVSDFIAYEVTKTTSLTRLGYVYDLRLFFRYLKEKITRFRNIAVVDMTPELLGTVTLVEFDRYAGYLAKYSKKDDEGNSLYEHGKPVIVSNGNVGISRKLSAVRSFYTYMYTHGFIESNIAKNMEMPKLRKKEVVYLTREEIEELFESVNSGDGLTKRQKVYNENFKRRDVAILSLLLGTGIRESELIGLDIDDIDLKTGFFQIIRKGEKEARIKMSQSVQDALEDYLEERNKISAEPGHEKAVFLSSQKKRLSVRALQDLVKKYAIAAVPIKGSQISVHKMRSTYATSHLRKANNLYMTSKNLGHQQLQTTMRYIAEDESNSEQAAEFVDWV